MKFIRIWSWLLVLLGFAAAGCTDDPYLEPSMYGTPNGTFSVKARVVDAQNTPLNNVLAVGVNSYAGRFDKGQLEGLLYNKTNSEGVVQGSWAVMRSDSVFLYVCDPAGKYADTLCGYKVDAAKEFKANDNKNTAWFWGWIEKEVEVVLKEKR